MPMLKFNGNYIKRISFYGGIIGFVAYLLISLGLWVVETNKDGEKIINDTKMQLAPFVEWHNNQYLDELTQYNHLTLEQLSKLDISLTIQQNLQDIKAIIENIKILSSFILPYGDEYGIAKELEKANRAMTSKMYIITALLERIQALTHNAHYIVNNPQLYQSFLDFKHFLENHIQDNFLDSDKPKKSSLQRMGYYYFPIISCYSVFTTLLLGDISQNPCGVDTDIVKAALSQYDFNQKSIQASFVLLDSFSKDNTLSDSEKKAILEYEKTLKKLIQISNKYKLNFKECK